MSILPSLALKAHTSGIRALQGLFRKDYMTTKKSTKKKQVLYKPASTKKTQKKIAKKTNPSVFNIKNKTYDIIKKIVAILPLFTALYIALAQIWGWGFGKEVDGTITAIVAFLNGVLGVFMLASSNAYHKGD